MPNQTGSTHRLLAKPIDYLVRIPIYEVWSNYASVSLRLDTCFYSNREQICSTQTVKMNIKEKTQQC